MNYIVFDLEWNQSNTGGSSVEGFPFEIIEIGAVKLTGDGALGGEFNELVRPQVYQEMHRITGKIIHLTMEELRHSRSFPEVATRFEVWCGEKPFLYCTWGTLDLMELQRNRRFFHMMPLAEKPIPYLDIQKLFALTFDTENPKKRRSLQDAVDFLRIEKHIPFHRAFSDAYYTAKVMQVILKKNPRVISQISYDVFYPPTSRETEVKHQFDDYFKYISRTFPGKRDLMTDKEVSSSKCYLCHRNLKKKVRWFSTNNRHYICLAYCEKHGYLKGKIRINRTQSGEVFAVKTTKLIDEKAANEIQARWDRIQGVKGRQAIEDPSISVQDVSSEPAEQTIQDQKKSSGHR